MRIGRAVKKVEYCERGQRMCAKVKGWTAVSVGNVERAEGFAGDFMHSMAANWLYGGAHFRSRRKVRT